MISTFFGRKFHFYSRPREGGDVVAMLWKYWYWISIHAPAKGATMNLFNLMFHFRISIHAPAKGATRKVIGCTVIFGISIHAPAKGATKGLFISSLNIGISIHAPAKGATRFCRDWVHNSAYFYSRPREGGDATECGKMRINYAFLFTPPRRGRQHTFIIFISICVQLLSIMHNAISLLFIFRT